MRALHEIKTFKGTLRLHVLGAALLAVALTTTAAESRATLKPGDQAPAINATATDGKAFSLEQKAGGATLLVFVKPVDRYASETLRGLERMFDHYPPLLAGTRIGIIISRVESEGVVKTFQKQNSPRWPVVVDHDDELYKAYRIVATPTVLIVDAKRRVTAAHPGYDAGMINEVRAALASARGMTLPEAMTDKKPAKPNMELQMARRLATRGLWEGALAHYAAAAKQGPLPPETQLEIAAIHLEMNNADAALAILGALPPELKQGERAKALTQRAEALKAGKGATPKPPVVER